MLGLDRYIAPQLLIVSGEIGVSKPDPGIFRAAQERIGLTPEDLWMIGDSYRADICGAKRCGWHTLWINCNGEKPGEVTSDLTVCSEEELCRAVRNLAGIAGSAQ
jgi:putative hydrolase of the HAD superfamily